MSTQKGSLQELSGSIVSEPTHCSFSLSINLSQVIFYFPITLQIFHPLFSSFSMTGCSLFAEGGQKRGTRLMLTLHLHRLERSREQRQLNKEGSLTAVSGCMPSVATTAQLNKYNAIALLRACGDHITKFHRIILLFLKKFTNNM